MTIQDIIRTELQRRLEEYGLFDEDAAVELEKPRDPTHGDLSTNVAMTTAKRLGRKPRELAGELAARLQFGEERKFELGSSNLIDVNIREIQTADAARALIFAQAAYFRAIARYEAAIAATKTSTETPGSLRPSD